VLFRSPVPMQQPPEREQLSPEDVYFINRDLPHVRQHDFKLDAAGWPNTFGRWSPALGANQNAMHVTVVTLDGTTGGTAGPHRGKAHYLDPDTAGLYDELARRLPTHGISVLQLAYRRPGPGRFDECIADAVQAVNLAATSSFVVVIGHSMGGAIALVAAMQAQATTGRLRGVCALAPQLFGVPSRQELAVLHGVSKLVVHGTGDQALPPSCSEDVWSRLGGDSRRGCLVLMDGATHCFEEHRDELTQLVYDWIMEVQF